MSRPSIPQGTRDFTPDVVRKRQYIFNTLRSIFELYGFQPIETPAMENLVTLTGKYGEEGDRLIFKILNNGLHEKKDADKEKLNTEWNKILSMPYSTPVVTERALRYDLTIPFARFVVMNQNELAFPFRRYQMQPVWRADRPQKGRYREFWQCDADIVGSNSLINEAELLCIYRQAFHELQIPVTIKLNSRKLLTAIAELCGIPEQLTDLTIALDKLDKIGWDGVAKELAERLLLDSGISKIKKITNISGANTEKLNEIAAVMDGIPSGMAGVEELRKTIELHEQLADKDWTSSIKIDISLARGLNYYTGIITEVVCSSEQVKMGSIGGGGRYDDLTRLFGGNQLSGVGISFGIDRIYDVMDELQLFPVQLAAGTKVMIINFGGKNESYGLQLLRTLRASGIATEIYSDSSKLDKQMKYANKRGIEYVILPGDEERLQNKLRLKNFITGHEQVLTIEECIEMVKG